MLLLDEPDAALDDASADAVAGTDARVRATRRRRASCASAITAPTASRRAGCASPRGRLAAEEVAS